MTKSDLVELVSNRLEKTARKEVEIIVDVVFSSITDALCRDERVEIRGWGSFVSKVREARQGRNPKTGAVVQVPKKRTPFFTVGKELKERVNQAFLRETS